MPYAHSDYSNLPINSIKNLYLNYSSTNYYEFSKKEHSRYDSELGSSKLKRNTLDKKNEQNYDYKPLPKLKQHHTKNRHKTFESSDSNGNEISNKINNGINNKEFNYKNKKNRFKRNELLNSSKYSYSKFRQNLQVDKINVKPLDKIKRQNNYEKYPKKSSYNRHQSSSVSSATDRFLSKSTSLNDEKRRRAAAKIGKPKQKNKKNQSTLTNLFYQYTALMQSQLLPAFFMFNNSTKLLPNLSNFSDNVTNKLSSSLPNSSFNLSYNSSSDLSSNLSSHSFFDSLHSSELTNSSTNSHSYFLKDFSFLKPQVSFIISSFNQNTYEPSFKTTNTSGFNDQFDSFRANQDQNTSALYTLLPPFQELNLNFLLTLLVSVIMVVCILVTAIGNLFVIAAILSDRVLRSVQNYLVLSLAFADLMVAILVMPLSAVNELKGQWTLGVLLCDIWTWADVLLCTASILHLLAIAMDRYWAVTSVEYMRSRSSGKILGLIGMVWFVALLVSVGPILGWKDEGFEKRVNEDGVCSYSQDLSYQLFATMSTFYAPLIFILFLYWKIFQVARKRLRNKPGNNQLLKGSSKATSSSIKTTNNQIQQESASIPNEDSTSSCSRSNSKYCKSITNEQNETNDSTESNEALVQQQETNRQTKQVDNRNCAYQDTNNNNPLMQSITDLTSSSPATTIIELNSSSNTPMHLIDAQQSNGRINGSLQQQNYQTTELLPMKQLSTTKSLSVVVADKDNKTTTTLILAEESSTQFNVDEQLMITCNGENAENSKKSSFKRSKSNKDVNQSNLNKEIAARLKQKQQQDSKRERKTARILAIITGVFVICWLPFFVLTLLKSLIPKYQEYTLLFSIFLWLGYLNSSLNPAIYTIFSPDFRSAFKKFLTRSRN